MLVLEVQLLSAGNRLDRYLHLIATFLNQYELTTFLVHYGFNKSNYNYNDSM